MESDGEKEEDGHKAEEGPAKKKQRNIQEESEFNGIYKIGFLHAKIVNTTNLLLCCDF